MIEKEHILNIFRSTDALLDGHFVLTSGRHSSSYFQCAKVLQHPEYLTAFSIIIADQFESQEPDVVISPAIGSCFRNGGGHSVRVSDHFCRTKRKQDGDSPWF